VREAREGERTEEEDGVTFARVNLCTCNACRAWAHALIGFPRGWGWCHSADGIEHRCPVCAPAATEDGKVMHKGGCTGYVGGPNGTKTPCKGCL
jgi:hypothetical protein